MQFSMEKSEDQGGSNAFTYCNTLIGLGFLIFYVYAFAKDDAGMNVKDNVSCTNMPDIFIFQFVLSGIGYLLTCYIVCMGKQQEVMAASPGFGGPGGGQEVPQGIMCIACFGLLLLGAYMALCIWTMEDYYSIDDVCFDLIEAVGSEAFKIACHMAGIMATIGISAFGCCCCCMCCLGMLAPQTLQQMQLEAAANAI